MRDTRTVHTRGAPFEPALQSRRRGPVPAAKLPAPTIYGRLLRVGRCLAPHVQAGPEPPDKVILYHSTSLERAVRILRSRTLLPSRLTTSAADSLVGIVSETDQAAQRIITPLDRRIAALLSRQGGHFLRWWGSLKRPGRMGFLERKLMGAKVKPEVTLAWAVDRSALIRPSAWKGTFFQPSARFAPWHEGGATPQLVEIIAHSPKAQQVLSSLHGRAGLALPVTEERHGQNTTWRDTLLFSLRPASLAVCALYATAVGPGLEALGAGSAINTAATILSGAAFWVTMLTIPDYSVPRAMLAAMGRSLKAGLVKAAQPQFWKTRLTGLGRSLLQVVKDESGGDLVPADLTWREVKRSLAGDLLKFLFGRDVA